jgi:hypothetical protein
VMSNFVYILNIFQLDFNNIHVIFEFSFAFLKGFPSSTPRVAGSTPDGEGGQRDSRDQNPGLGGRMNQRPLVELVV